MNKICLLFFINKVYSFDEEKTYKYISVLSVSFIIYNIFTKSLKILKRSLKI